MLTGLIPSNHIRLLSKCLILLSNSYVEDNKTERSFNLCVWWLNLAKKSRVNVSSSSSSRTTALPSIQPDTSESNRNQRVHSAKYKLVNVDKIDVNHTTLRWLIHLTS